VEKKVAVVVVVEHALSQVEQGAQLAQSAAVGLHLRRIVCQPKEDAAAVGGDVAPLLDDVENAAAHDLEKNKECFIQFGELLYS